MLQMLSLPKGTSCVQNSAKLHEATGSEFTWAESAVHARVLVQTAEGLVHLPLKSAGAARTVMTVHPCLCSRFCFHLHK